MVCDGSAGSLSQCSLEGPFGFGTCGSVQGLLVVDCGKCFDTTCKFYLFIFFFWSYFLTDNLIFSKFGLKHYIKIMHFFFIVVV